MIKNISNFKGILHKTPYKLFPMFTKFHFAKKKMTKSMMEDIFSQESQSIDQLDLMADVKHRQEFKVGAIPEEGETKPEKTVEQPTISPTAASTSEKITSKILCELIGTKHYPANEEIIMDKESVVSVFDENDKPLGNMSLAQALENAAALSKDIVLRNDKVRPPIVKMMKYRVELVKRLFKKIGKNLGKDLGEGESIKRKLMGFSLRMDPNDFESKLDKLRQLLAENNYVKIVIPVDLENKEQVLKATSILKNAASEVTQLGKIRAGPIKQKKKSEKIKTFDPSITASVDEFNRHDKVIKDAYEIAHSTYIETEKDLDFVDSICFELESLIVDSTGIDYEKLLHSSNIDLLVRGITHTNLIGEVSSISQESKRPISKELVEDRLSKGISHFATMGTASQMKKQLEVLEKEALVQQDYGKRLEIQDRIDKTEQDIFNTEARYQTKILKLKMINITRRSAEKAGLLDRNKA